MEFAYKSNEIILTSEKKQIVLSGNTLVLDGLTIDTAGEYEKGGFLLYVRDVDVRYCHFRAEGQWIGYIPEIPAEIDAKTLDFLGQLDILIAPFAKSEQKFLEQIEPRLLISYASNAAELISVLASDATVVSCYKLKSQDVSAEKTSLVILG